MKKRLWDIIVLLSVLIMLLPVNLILAVSIAIKRGRSVIFQQLRPEITGWAQLNSDNPLSWDQKFDLDVWYVKNQLLLDIKILWMTLFKVLKRNGPSHPGEASMIIYRQSKG